MRDLHGYGSSELGEIERDDQIDLDRLRLRERGTESGKSLRSRNKHLRRRDRRRQSYRKNSHNSCTKHRQHPSGGRGLLVAYAGWYSNRHARLEGRERNWFYGGL